MLRLYFLSNAGAGDEFNDPIFIFFVVSDGDVDDGGLSLQDGLNCTKLRSCRVACEVGGAGLDRREIAYVSSGCAVNIRRRILFVEFVCGDGICDVFAKNKNSVHVTRLDGQPFAKYVVGRSMESWVDDS